MAGLLKKVWESILSRSVSTSSSIRTTMDFPARPFSMGAFDQLPTDVIIQILRMIGPKETAKARSVCWAWKSLASDNMLWIFFLQNGKEPWDSVAFAETHLRDGFQSLIYLDPSLELSFMNIYSQREKVPGAVIIDGGSGYCKYGWSKYSFPSGRCATFLEFGNLESPMYSRLRHFFSTLYTRMQVKPSSQPIIVSMPFSHFDDTESARASRRQHREAIYKVLADLNVPAACVIDQAVLALYAAKRTSGIVVNIGFNVTTIVPILHGKVMRDVGVEIVGLGALKITGFLRELMQQRNIAFESLYTIRTLKEKLCYVAADYDAELREHNPASFEVAGEGWFTLSKERFQAAEILFQPRIGGVRAMGLHRAVALCIDHCASSEISIDGWYKTVVLAGGTACLPGLPQRMENELCKILESSTFDGIKVLPPSHGADSAWFGAKLISNVSTFLQAWCIDKKQLQRKSQRNASSAVAW